MVWSPFRTQGQTRPCLPWQAGIQSLELTTDQIHFTAPTIHLHLAFLFLQGVQDLNLIFQRALTQKLIISDHT